MSQPFQHAIVDVHGNYRAQRTAHEPPDELVSDLVTPRVLRPHLVRSGLFLSILIVMFVLTILLLFLGLIASLASSFSFSGGSSDESGFSVLGSCMFYLMVLVFLGWIVAMMLPVREPIAEYGLLIEGRASAAPACYAWIAHTQRQRHTPIGVSGGKVGPTPVLSFFHGRERAMIVVQQYGTDLYVGWSMWRGRSTFAVIAHLIRDMFQSSTMSSGFASEVRTAHMRAMRELVHSLTREGVQAAILQPPLGAQEISAEVDRLGSLTVPVPNFPVPPIPTQPSQP